MEQDMLDEPKSAAIRLYSKGNLDHLLEMTALSLGLWNGEAGRRVALDESILEELAVPGDHASGTAALTFFALQYNLSMVPIERCPEGHVYLNRRKKHIESVAIGYGKGLVSDMMKTFDLSESIGDAIDMLANISGLVHDDYTGRIIEVDMMLIDRSGKTNLEKYGFRVYSLIVQHIAENIRVLREPNRYCACLLREYGTRYHKTDKAGKEDIIYELAAMTKKKPSWFCLRF